MGRAKVNLSSTKCQVLAENRCGGFIGRFHGQLASRLDGLTPTGPLSTKGLGAQGHSAAS